MPIVARLKFQDEIRRSKVEVRITKGRRANFEGRGMCDLMMVRFCPHDDEGESLLFVRRTITDGKIYHH